ncbi:unnamed protein product [Anisakis simplex]|uniref:Lipocalin domain-containing protein n=1 Tax=Anisakis simplex TaxID=6269 RepID=A0A158PMX3_ANISI|nr:unnamed protein product [Anisakis simplex]
MKEWIYESNMRTTDIDRQEMLFLVGLFLVTVVSARLSPSDRPVLIRLQPQPHRPNFMKDLTPPKTFQSTAQKPSVPSRPDITQTPTAAPPGAHQPVIAQTTSSEQKFIPREIVTPPPPPPVNIPTDVQNQLIKFFGLDSFGIPGLTGNHPNGFAGAIQELRAAGFPVQGLPFEHATGGAAPQAPQSDVLTQANPAFGNQLNQLLNEASGPTNYHGSGNVPLPESTPGENGLIGLLSSSIKKLVQDSGVADAISQGLPTVLGTRASSSSDIATAHSTDSVSSQAISKEDIPHSSGIRRQQTIAQKALSGIAAALGGGGNGPTHAGLPRIPGIPLLPGGIPRNAQGQIDVVQLIGSITRRISNGTTIADVLPPEQLQTLADNVTDALLPATPENFDLHKFMGRWFEGINSPRATEQRCVVHHYGGLTKNAKTATFTALKIYREGSEFGPVRYSIGYAFRGGNKDTMLQLHSSESADAQPFWIYKLGPEGKDPFGNTQYEWAIVSNWVKYPVTVLVRDPDTFKAKYEVEVLRWLEDQGFINGFIRAFNMLQPAGYGSCQYADSTFEVFGPRAGVNNRRFVNECRLRFAISESHPVMQAATLLLLAAPLIFNYAVAIGENPLSFTAIFLSAIHTASDLHQFCDNSFQMDINTLTGIIGGLGNMIQNNVQTIKVPSKFIMGRWFQMYKAAVNFDVFRAEMFCPVAYFRPNAVMGEDGFSIEEAYRVVSKNGPIETYKRDLNKVGPGQYWMYTEEYFYPRQFYIVKVGPNYDNGTDEEPEKPYEYMIVTDATRLALMVYARDPLTFFQNYNKEVVDFLEKAGFGGRIFWNSPRPIYQGPDCEWPSEKEVFARRVLKNHEEAQRSKNEGNTTTTTNVGGEIAQMLQNPHLALQKLLLHLLLLLHNYSTMFLFFISISYCYFSLTYAQLDAFALPAIPRYAAKPTVPPEYKSFFELDGHARELVETLIGPRPGGFFPEKSFEIARPNSAAPTANGGAIGEVERTLEQFFTAPEGPSDQKFELPPGFNQGFSLANSNGPATSFSHSKKPESTPIEEEVEGSGTEEKNQSSIRGIPNVFPDLAKPPVALQQPRVKSIVSDQLPEVPKFQSRPEVPEGGFGPSEVRRAPTSVGQTESASESDEYGALTDENSSSGGGLIGTIINLIGLSAKKRQNAASEAVASASGLGKAVGDLIGGENSPIPGKNMISNVLYKALTSGSILGNNTTENGTILPLVLTPAQKAAIGENLEMIQNLITQPSSPLCNPKPVPVAEFNTDAFMGQWYQVVYSPPLSTGPCSMVSYKKLADVNDGGVGTIFEIFEYTTDGTPYTKPRISSGYAILKQAGELIYRTTSYQEDVNVHVIHVGPLDANGQYSFAIMSTNCNYPLYVFARDPVVYKQRYEAMVNQILEQKGLVNGFSRLLNIVSSVDNTICTFPPSLFSIHT